MRYLLFALAALAATAATSGLAQSVGEREYMNSCAACHGPGGTGDGPMVGYLTGSIPDLTQLSAANGGVFPVTKVYATIDGTMAAGPHGTSEMPVWGNRYQLMGEKAANPDFAADEAEVFVKFRILALTEFLAGLQE
ncbi:c-type cytochrome [Tropicimonas marinistellae]|uniref:c-type cytochrome n=1 Tax=Tropicimonas marinistellae TaxID=1739787 RepID=UPI00083762FA|nr:c-type cytochrome [Tropicimonas marinistellae]